MQIATWNVNSIRTRQQIVTEWLQHNPVDILCLQETKVQNEQFPVTHFAELGYHVYISGQKSYNGVAIFSREPLKELKCGFGSILSDDALIQQFDAQKRVISAVISNIQIVNLYVPNGSAVGSEKYQYKLAWLALLKKYLQTIQATQSREICICGDFNIALEDRDIYNPKGKTQHIMASAEERSALQEVLNLGLQDAFRKFTSEQGYYTWWDYRAAGFQRDRGWRIDHHYLTTQLYQQATKCWIDLEPRKLEKPSDHAPVILEIEM